MEIRCNELLTKINKMVEFGEIREEIVQNLEQSKKMKLDKKYYFYYDETNNFRTFYLKNGKFNQDLSKFFVLAGVCCDNVIKDFSELDKMCEKLKLKEIKHGAIVGNNDFEKSMGKEELNALLKWIDANNLFLHCEAIDHVQVIVNDLCDMCGVTDTSRDRFVCQTAFYKYISDNAKEVEKLLEKFSYPNVKKGDISKLLKEFSNKMKDYVNKIKCESEMDALCKEIMWNLPLNFIETAITKEDERKFDKREKIIDNYTKMYLLKPLLFLNSEHTFDEEEKIIENINNDYQITINGIPLENYGFADSVDTKLIQISDVIVYLFGRFFEYIKDFEVGNQTQRSVGKLLSEIKGERQRKNFCLFMKIIRKSKRENSLFISIDTELVNMKAFDLLTSIKNIEHGRVSLLSQKIDL